MTDDVKKKTWIDRVEATASYHKQCLRENESWRIEDTAKALERSVGRVSEDLMVNDWLKTHRHILEKFRYIGDAVDFIRKRKKEMRTM